MKTKLRLASLFLALLLLASLWGCSMPGIGDKNNIQITNESTAPAMTVTEDTTAEPFYVICTIPAQLDYKNAKVGMLFWSDAPYNELSFEYNESEDIVAQAIYDRNIYTEERLGVDLVVVEKKGAGTSEAEWISYVSNCVKSDFDDIDIIAGVSFAVGECARQGLLFNMLDESCEHLNFEQPWWYESFATDARIGNGLYFSSGDISLNLIESMYVCYSNDDLIAKYSLPDPVELVEEGKWTFEQLMEMSTGIYTEAEGNYGFSSSFGITLDPWFYASGARYCELDANGQIIASPSFSGDKVTETVKLLMNFLNSDEVNYPENSESAVLRIFSEGNSLFIFDNYAESHTFFSDTDVNFTILPVPKYNEDQERYYTVPGNSYTLYAMTANAEDPARASAILECMASEGHRRVTPSIYLRAYKLLNYTDDPSSLMIYDLLRESLVYDHGRLFAEELIGQNVFRNAAGNTADWQSYIGIKRVNKYLKNLQSKSERLNESFAKAGIIK